MRGYPTVFELSGSRTAIVMQTTLAADVEHFVTHFLFCDGIFGMAMCHR